jgi:hypothetical protein
MRECLAAAIITQPSVFGPPSQEPASSYLIGLGAPTNMNGAPLSCSTSICLPPPIKCVAGSNLSSAGSKNPSGHQRAQASWMRFSAHTGWNLLPAPKVPASQHWIGGENRSANEARDIRRGSEHACGYQLNHQGDRSRQPITTNDGTSRIPFVARPLRPAVF